MEELRQRIVELEEQVSRLETENLFLQEEASKNIPYSPLENSNVISLIKQKDGNWKAISKYKYNSLRVARTAGPQDALLAIITDHGTIE